MPLFLCRKPLASRLLVQPLAPRHRLPGHILLRDTLLGQLATQLATRVNPLQIGGFGGPLRSIQHLKHEHSLPSQSHLHVAHSLGEHSF